MVPLFLRPWTQQARLTPIPGWGEMLPGGSRGIAASQRQGQKGVQDTPKDRVSYTPSCDSP